MAGFRVVNRGGLQEEARKVASGQLPGSVATVRSGSSSALPIVYMPAPTGGDDTANLTAAIASLPTVSGVANVGVIQFQPGAYQLASTLTHGRGQIFRGAGGQGDGIPVGTTTITFTNNGQGWLVPHNLYRWGIEDLTILGTPANGSQDLLTIGDASGGVGPGYVHNVGIFNSGQDNLVLASALNVDFDNCMIEGAGRYDLYSNQLTASTNNQIRFSRCRFRTAQQWGIRWSGGTDVVFADCDIESNSQSTTASYGGVLIDSATGTSNLTFVACHFENNTGAAGGGQTGIPLSIAAANINTSVAELGTTYSETNSCSLTGGSLTSVGINTGITTHIVIANSATVSAATFIGPVGNGKNFALTDNKKVAIVLNPRGNAGSLTLPANSTGAGSAALGANCPATTVTAPYTWIKMISGDGSTVFVPAWK